MDPVSILSAASGASKAAYTVSTTIYTFVTAAKVVDKTLKELQIEIDGLSRILVAIESTLRQPIIAGNRGAPVAQDSIWGSIELTIKDSQRTIAALQDVVDNLGIVQSSSGFFKKAITQVKFNLDSDEINGVKGRIQSHTLSLQLGLQLATILLSSQNSDNVINAVNPKFDELVQEIERLRARVEASLNSIKVTGANNKLPTSFQNHDFSKHAVRLISSASTVIGASSTVWGGSEIRFPPSSVRSQHLNRARAERVDDWVPQLATTEEGMLRTGDDLDISATFDTLVGQTEYNAEEIDSSDSDGDEHFDFAQKSFRKAEKRYTIHQHAEAVDFFEAGLTHAKSLSLERKRALKLTIIQLKMALSLLHMGNIVDAKQRFLSLASSQTTDDESARLALHASAGMAIICLCTLSFTEAEDWCKKSRVGWRRMVGKQHHQYVTSMRLTALACELKGNVADAAIFNEIADDTNAKSVPESDESVSLSFTAKQSRNVVTRYHRGIAHDYPKDLRLALHQAAKEGDEAAIRYFLRKRAVIDAQDSQGCTALHVAMRKGHLAVIETLLKNNAQLEARDQEERTPLLSLGPRTGTEALRTLLQAGADIEARDKKGRTALHHATRHPDSARIHMLLLFRAPLEQQDQDLYTPLLMALYWYEYRKPTTILRNVKILLEAGANVNAVNKHGRGAVVIGCSSISRLEIHSSYQDHQKYVSVIEILCSRGANVSKRDKSWLHPISSTYEIKNKQLRRDVVAVLKRYGAK